MFVRLTKIFCLAALVAQMVGCGGGSSTNGTISIAAPSSVTAGKSFQVSAAVTSATANSSLVTIPVSFISSDPTIIPTSTADTDATGLATVQLTAANIINADKEVTITAKTGGVTSSAKVIVRANKLTFTAPTKATATVPAGGAVEFIFSGSSIISYTNADGESLGIKDITLKVFNKTSNVTNIFWHDNLTDNTYLADNPRTFKTDTFGNLPNSVVSVVGVAPAAGISSDGNVTLQISVSDPSIGTIIRYGDVGFTITGQ